MFISESRVRELAKEEIRELRKVFGEEIEKLRDRNRSLRSRIGYLEELVGGPSQSVVDWGDPNAPIYAPPDIPFNLWEMVKALPYYYRRTKPVEEKVVAVRKSE